MCLNHTQTTPTRSVEKSSSIKLVPSAKNIGDHCPRASVLWLPGEYKMWNVNTQSSETAWTFLTPQPWEFPLPRSHTLSRRLFSEGREALDTLKPMRTQGSGVPAKCRVRRCKSLAFRPLLFAGITGELIRNMDLGLPGLAKPMPAT